VAGADTLAADTVALCEADLQPRIEVVFQDREVARYSTFTVTDLNRMAGNRRAEYHNVYGLTYANPDFRLMARPLTVELADGSICAVPEIRVELSLSDFRVYLAKELVNACQQMIIREHEEEHVRIWRSQLRASARLLETALRNNAGAPRAYASQSEAVTGVNAWALQLVAPWMNRIVAVVTSAQAAIDTQKSYDTVRSQLRTCK
jgi:hypothetical protein